MFISCSYSVFQNSWQGLCSLLGRVPQRPRLAGTQDHCSGGIGQEGHRLFTPSSQKERAPPPASLAKPVPGPGLPSATVGRCPSAVCPGRKQSQGAVPKNTRDLLQGPMRMQIA